MKKTILFLCLWISSIISVEANDLPKVGFFGGYNSNSMATDFSTLTGVPNLSKSYTNDNGLGYHLGMMFQYPLGNSFHFGIRSFVSDWNSQLSAIDQEELLLNGVPTNGTYENRINILMNVFSFEPNISYNVWDNIFIHAGLGFNFTANHRFEKSDIILEPSEAIFMDNPNAEDEMVRNDVGGSFANVPAVMLSANLGLYYDAPLNKSKTLFISPGVFYQIGMTNFRDNVDWKMNQMYVTVGLKYAFGSNTQKEVKTVEQIIIDTIKVNKPNISKNEIRIGKLEIIKSRSETDKEITHMVINRRTDTLLTASAVAPTKQAKLKGDVFVFGIDEAGNSIEKPRFVSEEFISNRNQPLLNYIFFDSVSFDIPERYNKLNIADAKTFQIESLYKKSNIETYYNILNIIGYRLANLPQAKLTIKGCNSHIGGERWNQILSRNRANSIANYLSSVWGIEKERLEVVAVNLPDNYSFPSNLPDKAQENRRVEVYSNTYDVLAPIFVNDTAIINQPPRAKFVITAEAEAGFANWNVNVVNHTEAGIKNIAQKGNGIPPQEIDINLEQLVENNFNPNSNLTYSLGLTDNNNNKFASKEKSFQIEKISVQKKRTEKIGDMEIERYSLILFDFISDVLNPYNLKTIERVKSRLTPNSNIRIIGYTDLSGEAKDNKILSLKRAESAYKALGRKDAIVEGKGEEIELYDNSTPEGRIYSRTVEIIVETPVK